MITNFKKRLFITIGIPLAICLILSLVLFFIGLNITSQTAQIEKLKGDLFNRQQLAQSLASLKQGAEQAQPYLTELENILPSQDQLLGFSRDIGIIAGQNKLNLNTTLGQQISQSGDGLRQTDFTSTAQGSFDNFINFLKSLENGRYFIKLNTLDLTSQDGDFNMLIKGQIFSL